MKIFFNLSKGPSLEKSPPSSNRPHSTTIVIKSTSESSAMPFPFSTTTRHRASSVGYSLLRNLHGRAKNNHPKYFLPESEDITFYQQKEYNKWKNPSLVTSLSSNQIAIIISDTFANLRTARKAKLYPIARPAHDALANLLNCAMHFRMLKNASYPTPLLVSHTQSLVSLLHDYGESKHRLAAIEIGEFTGTALKYVLQAYKNHFRPKVVKMSLLVNPAASGDLLERRRAFFSSLGFSQVSLDFLVQRYLLRNEYAHPKSQHSNEAHTSSTVHHTSPRDATKGQEYDDVIERWAEVPFGDDLGLSYLKAAQTYYLREKAREEAEKKKADLEKEEAGGLERYRWKGYRSFIPQ